MIARLPVSSIALALCLLMAPTATAQKPSRESDVKTVQAGRRLTAPAGVDDRMLAGSPEGSSPEALDRFVRRMAEDLGLRLETTGSLPGQVILPPRSQSAWTLLVRVLRLHELPHQFLPPHTLRVYASRESAPPEALGSLETEIDDGGRPGLIPRPRAYVAVEGAPDRPENLEGALIDEYRNSLLERAGISRARLRARAESSAARDPDGPQDLGQRFREAFEKARTTYAREQGQASTGGDQD